MHETYEQYKLKVRLAKKLKRKLVRSWRKKITANQDFDDRWLMLLVSTKLAWKHGLHSPSWGAIDSKGALSIGYIDYADKFALRVAEIMVHGENNAE